MAASLLLHANPPILSIFPEQSIGLSPPMSPDLWSSNWPATFRRFVFLKLLRFRLSKVSATCRPQFIKIFNYLYRQRLWPPFILH